MAARFEVSVPAGEIVPDMMDIWQMVPDVASGGVAFDAAGPPDGVAWRVDLPADPAAAARLLDDRAARLAAVQRALPQAEQRLKSFVASTAQAASFDPAMPAPERELALLVQAVRGPESFFPGEQWQDIAGQARAFFERVRQALLYLAWVETSQDGAPVARTRITWLGDVETVWQHGAGPQQAALHQKTLALALESRAAWLHIAVQIVRNAALLSTILSGPGGAILAVPAVWRFIKDVLQTQTH